IRDTLLSPEEAGAEDGYTVGAPEHGGQIGGSIFDAAGAAIPRAHVTVIHVASGKKMNTEADSNGHWRISDVPAGRVRIIVDATGFKRKVRDVIQAAGVLNTQNSTLQVAVMTETVTVNAEAVGVATSQAEAGKEPASGSSR